MIPKHFRLDVAALALAILVAVGGALACAVAYQRTQKVDQAHDAEQIIADWLTYSKPDQFKIRYPVGLEIRDDANANGAYLDTPITQISFSRNSFADKKTNYAEAYLAVSSSKKADVVSSCVSYDDFPYLRGENGENAPAKQVMINGVLFYQQRVTGAAAGNIYDSDLYRTVHDGKCYEIGLTVHTGNIYNYDPGTVNEFDPSLVMPTLERMISTFEFVQE